MLFHRSFGDPKKPLLIFLHGFLGSSEDFLPLMEPLSKEFFSIAIDLPGHGKSPYAPGIVSAVQKTINSFGKDSTLIGYSMGGRIAMQLEAKALIAISAHTGLPSSAQKQKEQENLFWKDRLLTLDTEAFLSLWYKQVVFSSLQKDPKRLASLIQKRRFQNKEELSFVLEEMSLAKGPLFDPFLRPTFLLYGEEDEKYKALYKHLPSSICKEVSPGGHALIEENPLAVVKEIQQFLKKETLCKLH